jgi:hypothetical protein
MQRKQEFICKNLDEGMELAVAFFHLSPEKIFLNILDESDEEIKRILEIKKSKRTDNDKTILETFKKNIRSMYMQFQELTITEKLDEGKKTKIERCKDLS